MQRLIRADGDRVRERVEGHVADQPRPADVALEVVAAEREIGIRQLSRRLTHHRLHPVAAELVAVAVEEDVELLRDVGRGEELGVRAPEHGLGATRAERAQAVESALGVRHEQVVLGRLGVVVPVESGVHPPELGQAHRRVAVVEDDGDVEPLP